MKIIYDPVHDWEEEFKCSCGIIFVADVNDIESNDEHGYSIYFIKCPICGHSHDVIHISNALKLKVKSKYQTEI